MGHSQIKNKFKKLYYKKKIPYLITLQGKNMEGEGIEGGPNLTLLKVKEIQVLPKGKIWQ